MLIIIAVRTENKYKNREYSFVIIKVILTLFEVFSGIFVYEYAKRSFVHLTRHSSFRCKNYSFFTSSFKLRQNKYASSEKILERIMLIYHNSRNMLEYISFENLLCNTRNTQSKYLRHRLYFYSFCSLEWLLNVKSKISVWILNDDIIN